MTELNLDELIASLDRATITVNQRVLQLKNYNELSVEDMAEMHRVGNELEACPDEEYEKRLMLLREQMQHITVESLDDEYLNGLTLQKLAWVADFFLAARMQEAVKVQEEITEKVKA